MMTGSQPDAWREYLITAVSLPAGAVGQIERAANLLIDVFRHDGILLVCGNGGSASDAGHMVGELVKSFRRSRPIDARFREASKELPDKTAGESLVVGLQGGFRALSLSAHTELVTAIANDQGAEYCFAQQVAVWGRAGSCLLAISTSGSSRNVVLAAMAARCRGMRVIALTGPEGGTLAELAEVTICAPGAETAAVQDHHRPIIHALCMAVEDAFYG